MMTSKERVMATINFEPVDRPAVFPLEGSVCAPPGFSFRRLGKAFQPVGGFS